MMCSHGSECNIWTLISSSTVFSLALSYSDAQLIKLNDVIVMLKEL